jgi:hypothetical protein|eukprot:CAMPEP_0174287050 /NCGR_PEP_ID=MMETSP0809-20121228/14186_1 /TAXON_ID=73025 ORGANISM="Eutreptiella gymnastica-like, Strain CCMP1594" /NCGR_SAMPLE_ID=MMETSP0809 /ASSEMBLY_ACC=CAM_ASM_000658 /LENGTH=193 /DNA_ID=CAMNT_0015383387 /DNA_START=17 /DNA_END=598 /DNA_ORIENTATION=+
MAAAHVVQFEPHSVRSEEFLTTYGHVQQPPASPVKDLLKTAVVSFFATTLVLGLVSVLRTPSTRLYAPAQATRVANPAITRGAFVVKAESKDALDALEALEESQKKVAEEEAKKNVEYDAAGNAFIDDLDEIEPERPQMSEAMKRRLRAEYTSLGGSPNAKSTNYFLYISIIISVLAVLTWLSGGCDTGIPLF